MSITTKKQSTDKKQDYSDVLSMLESIETLFVACQKVLNTYSQSALILSITNEAEMLLLKLQVMKERWEYHLPFKEASKVDFYDWGKKVEFMSQTIGGAEVAGTPGLSLAEFCPSKHFMLDLYECLDESPSHNGGSKYYTELNINKFISTQDRLCRLITQEWWSTYKYSFSDLVVRELAPRIKDVLQPLADWSVNIRLTCYEVLTKLSTLLYQLYEMPKGVITPEQFARLAERVLSEQEYGGKKASMSASHEVDTIKNGTPKAEWPRQREEEIKTTTELISEMKYGRRVFDFLGDDYNFSNYLPGLGQFLVSVRGIISKGELYDLMELLYRNLFLIEDRNQQASAEAKQNAKAAAESRETVVVQPAQKDALAVQRKRKLIKPERPKLPYFFVEALANNDKATDKFYDTLHHCGFYMGRALLDVEKHDSKVSCYEGWKWKHLREAFVKLGFIPADSAKKGFAEFLANVFPYLGSSNVQRSFNSRGGADDPVSNRRIVADIIKEFQPVKDIMTGN